MNAKKISTKYLEVGDHYGHIDLRIYDLVKELWHTKAHTFDDYIAIEGSMVSIMFQCSHGAEFLLNAIFLAEERFDNFSISARSTSSHIDGAKQWEFWFAIMDPSEIEGLNKNIYLAINVRFPYSDYSEVLHRLKKFTKSQ